jgi:hypothetical protein
MQRMGHPSPRAALIYQHTIRDRGETIAAAMKEVFVSTRRRGRARYDS